VEKILANYKEVDSLLKDLSFLPIIKNSLELSTEHESYILKLSEETAYLPVSGNYYNYKGMLIDNLPLQDVDKKLKIYIKKPT
jgi:hypothetical protein